MADGATTIQPIADAGFLDGRYEAFGRVTKGLDLVTRINAVKTGGNLKKPQLPIRIDASGELKLDEAS